MNLTMKSATYGAEKRCSNYGLVNLYLCLRQPKHAKTPLNNGKSASVKIKENKAKSLSFYNDREKSYLMESLLYDKKKRPVYRHCERFRLPDS